MTENSQSSSHEGGGHFNTTAWTLVRAAGVDTSVGRQSLETLCRNYWSPLYVWLRRSGTQASDAEDQLQGFFTHLIEHGVLSYADPARGRFRSFLIASLKQFLAKEHHFQNAEKRRPAAGIVSLDTERVEAAFRLRGSAEETAEQAFDRAWAMTVIEQVNSRLRDEFVSNGKGDLFDALSGTLTGQKELSGRELAERLHMTESAVRVAAHRLRQRFGAMLRQEIAETVDRPDEVEDELLNLIRALKS